MQRIEFFLFNGKKYFHDVLSKRKGGRSNKFQKISKFLIIMVLSFFFVFVFKLFLKFKLFTISAIHYVQLKVIASG